MPIGLVIRLGCRTQRTPVPNGLVFFSTQPHGIELGLPIQGPAE